MRFVLVHFPGFMRMKRSGFDLFLPTQRRKKPYRTSTSSLCNGWVGPLSFPREEVNILLSFTYFILAFYSIKYSSPLKIFSTAKICVYIKECLICHKIPLYNLGSCYWLLCNINLCIAHSSFSIVKV